MSFPNNGCAIGLDGNSYFGDIDGDKGAAVLPGENATGFYGFSTPSIKAEDPVGLRDREPAFDIGEFTAMGFARADLPAVEISPQGLYLFC